MKDLKIIALSLCGMFIISVFSPATLQAMGERRYAPDEQTQNGVDGTDEMSQEEMNGQQQDRMNGQQPGQEQPGMEDQTGQGY